LTKDVTVSGFTNSTNQTLRQFRRQNYSTAFFDWWLSETALVIVSTAFLFVIADTAEIIMAVFYDHNFVSLFGLLFLCEAINQRTMMDCTPISHRQ
jgi:hypothetical protein